MHGGCRFRFGLQFAGRREGEGEAYEGADYLAVWIGQDHPRSASCVQPPCFNRWWHGAALELARERGLSVAYYAYIIAFLAKASGLQDCDVGTPSLCQKGAQFVRTHEEKILQTYAHFANETSRWVGNEEEVLWCAASGPAWRQRHSLSPHLRLVSQADRAGLASVCSPDTGGATPLTAVHGETVPANDGRSAALLTARQVFSRVSRQPLLGRGGVGQSAQRTSHLNILPPLSQHLAVGERAGAVAHPLRAGLPGRLCTHLRWPHNGRLGSHSGA